MKRDNHQGNYTKAVTPRDNFIGEFKYYLLLSMNNENKLDRISVQLQNESLTISFVSKFCLHFTSSITRSRDDPT